MKKIINKRGFTLVEIIVVVGIVILISSIAIFSFLRGRINANAAAARGGIQAISAALERFHTSKGTYTDALEDLTEGENPYLAESFSDGNNQGYDYVLFTEGTNRYLVFGYPEIDDVTGSLNIISYLGSIMSFGNYEDALIYITQIGFDTSGMDGGPEYGGELGGFKEGHGPATPLGGDPPDFWVPGP